MERQPSFLCVPDTYLHEFVRTNGGNTLPYHNLLHALRVSSAAVEAVQQEQASSGLSQMEVNTVAVAGLFHDWGHPGVTSPPGSGGDATNVARSAEKVLSLPEVEDFPWDRESAAEAVRGTVFPLPEGVTISYMACVLRDADVWHVAALSPADLLAVQVGLAEEMGVPFVKWLEGNAEFYENMDAFTSWARLQSRMHRKRLVATVKEWALAAAATL